MKKIIWVAFHSNSGSVKNKNTKIQKTLFSGEENLIGDQMSAFRDLQSPPPAGLFLSFFFFFLKHLFRFPWSVFFPILPGGYFRLFHPHPPFFKNIFWYRPFSFLSLYWVFYNIDSVLFWLFGHEACGILGPHKESNLHPLHWKVRS